MILTAYHYDGDPDALLAGHRKMLEHFPQGSLDIHLAVAHERGLIVYDACPDRPTQQAFAASEGFRTLNETCGLPFPRVEVLGEVHHAEVKEPVTA